MAPVGYAGRVNKGRETMIVTTRAKNYAIEKSLIVISVNYCCITNNPKMYGLQQ